MASFPPRLPHYFIDRFTKKGDLVLDPFSGRGTTVLESAIMGRQAIGNDLNPIAYILTKAKLNIPSKKALEQRVDSLKRNFKDREALDIPDDIKMLYSDRVLKQLSFLKDELETSRRKTDTFILAIILGAMHGDSTSSKPSFLSIPMPNTFSMSPNYVRNYIKKHNLKPPTHDVFETLKYRIDRLYKDMSWKENYVSGESYNKDIRNLRRIVKKRKADMIFTSPPYLKVIRYGRMNWIRLWMLNANPKEVDEKLDDKHTLSKYLKFMEETLNLFYDVLAEDGLAFVVVGDVNSYKRAKKKSSIILGDEIKKELEGKVKLEFLDIVNDNYDTHAKVSRIWGKTKGEATRYDQILVLAKDSKAIKRKKYKKKAEW